MNGRIYDPILRQFMSPDNYVQDPYNTQNFNRFGYVLNNPLLYTDPSGEILVPILIGIGVAMLTTAIANISAGIPFWHGMGKAAVVGAISGAISFGIGEAVTGITSFWAKAGLQAGLHGMKSGMMSAIEGGNFLSGFAAGAISSLVSSGVEALGNSGAHFCVDDAGNDVVSSTLGSRNVGALKAVMIASGGLSGGISSSIAGGSFWKGVREGVITSGLNHLAHMVVDDGGGGKGDSYDDEQQYSSKGEKHIFYADTEKNKKNIAFAKNAKTQDNTIDLYGHGNYKKIEGMDSEQLHNYLMQESEFYRTSIELGMSIKIRIFSCFAGQHVKGINTLAWGLSKLNTNATIIAGSSYVGFFNDKYGIMEGGKWFSFNNGSKSLSLFDKKFTGTAFAYSKSTRKWEWYRTEK
jgi:hypothetical protein